MTDYERIEKIIHHLIAHQEDQPDLEELARAAGLSKFHFQRLFTRWAGVSPKVFLKFITAVRARSLLRDSSNVLDAAYGAGLSGPGRLHDLMVTVDGVTPGEFKALGEGIEIRYGFHPTPFGFALVGVTDRGICHLSFMDRTRERASELYGLRRTWPRAKLREDQKGTAVLLRLIFKRTSQKRGLKLLLVGSGFQLKVWEALLSIPAGRVSSYGEIARSIGLPKASRAVGTAVGSNALAYLIPCHRVIRKTGLIGDYRWGPSRKHALLLWEQGSLATED